ncbi:FUSC family protein [Alteromonas pelagimontana]|uniref:FUSC family protein n=1 Tax=Alteromonas pelagimontana TaxID=1858656 RepID=A0A6M4MD33_9ALTE|nr:FUSC family protein [Alteromonas pelagimontana]QJR81101.1 FUSC family protein [Alteromonas pelagimontana]
MYLSPLPAVYLTPDKRTLIFALKGVIAMAMALYVAMYLDLERPYWALVSAVFLQVRPESGMVLEKALCQIVGTLVGGGLGLAVLHYFHAAPELALGILALWLGVNSGMSAMVRRINFIYAFAMAGITPCIIVVLSMASPASFSSDSAFNIAQARMSEIIIGALCAMVVSMLFWPQRVQDALRQQARTAINQTMDYLTLELDPSGSHESRHERIDVILESLAALNDDSSAVIYEGPEGPGRSRAATVICNKILSLVAVIQIFGRLQRNYPELMTGVMGELLANLRTDLQRITDSNDFDECYQLAQAQRRRLLKSSNDTSDVTPLEARLLKTAQEMVAELVVVLRAYNALGKGEKSVLKAPRQQPYRDPLIGFTTGFRTFLVFSIGASIWMTTGSAAAIMLMILPVIFSIMFARLPPMVVTAALRKLLKGVFVAIPVAIFFALNLLAQSSGDFEVLVLVLAAPYFLGLMAIANREVLPYGLGFCIPFTILVQPGNHMAASFAIDFTLSSALAIVVGVSILFWVFKIFTGPGVELMQYRLLSAIRRDLEDIPYHDNPQDWFNARMGDRLLRLANYEKDEGSQTRVLTDLGLTGLNIGHASLRLRGLLISVSGQQMQELLESWQRALADTFLLCAKGQQGDSFRRACNEVLTYLKGHEQAKDHLPLIEGMFERLNLTFERAATMVADSQASSKSVVTAAALS